MLEPSYVGLWMNIVMNHTFKICPEVNQKRLLSLFRAQTWHGTWRPPFMPVCWLESSSSSPSPSPRKLENTRSYMKLWGVTCSEMARRISAGGSRDDVMWPDCWRGCFWFHTDARSSSVFAAEAEAEPETRLRLIMWPQDCVSDWEQI